MSKNHLISVDFDKLNNIPYINKFPPIAFRKDVEEALEFWSQYEEHYDQVALIRAIECTNGCIQYAYRDNEDYALPLEQTRECMDLSMKFIIRKELTLPNGEHIKLHRDLGPALDKVRLLYIDGFKKQDKIALRKFYANSVAMFNLVGYNRIKNAVGIVKQHYNDLFTPQFIFFGLNYMKQFLQVLNDEQTQKEIDEEDFIYVYSHE